MNKAELIKEMANVSDMSKQNCENCLNAFMNVVSSQLAEGEKIIISGFGSFEAKKRAGHIGRNPKTKEEIAIPASVKPVFKAGKALKDAVNT